MDVQADILSFLDLLDLDEDIIDKRFKSIVVRSNHTNKQLQNVLLLLQYKNLINTQEDSDCPNDDEYDFAVKLVRQVNNKNVDYICKIIYIVLYLNKSNIIIKSEHLIQQILLNTDILTDKFDPHAKEDELSSQIMINLKLCGSILDAIVKSNNKMSLPFLDTPLEKILDYTDEKLKLYFLTITVPKLFIAVVGYNILDRIWKLVANLEGEQRENALKILNCLSEYYLPIPDAKGKVKYESEIVFVHDFWDIILFGIMSNDAAIRKIAIYLSKRAIDCVLTAKKDVCIQSDTNIIFSWNRKDSKKLKSMWDNFFILIDSLEEKQSNIVLPSLKLFGTIDIGKCWLNAAFNTGLRHDNIQVRLKCTEYKLKTKVKNQSEALVLLEAYNDINIYDDDTIYRSLKTGIGDLFEDPTSFLAIFSAIPCVKWSSVPFYHITDVLANLMFKPIHDIFNTIIDIVKVPCNNVLIRKAARINLATFIQNCCDNLSLKDTANIFSIMELEPQKFPIVIEQHGFKEGDKYIFFKTLSNNATDIDLILLYLSNNKNDMNVFIFIINEKIAKLIETIGMPNSVKINFLKDLIFLTHLLSKTKDRKNSLEKVLHDMVAKQNIVIIKYMLSLFMSYENINLNDAAALLEKHNYKFEDESLEYELLELYNISTLNLKNNPSLARGVLSLLTIKMLHSNTNILNKFNDKMLNLESFLDTISNYQFEDAQNARLDFRNESVGRLKSIFYEKTGHIVYQLIEQETPSCIKEIISYIENVLECGGYGSLIWILKIVNKVVVPLVSDASKFNMEKFMNRVWYEIEELKSSNQYSPCMEEFVELITQDAILSKAMYHNIVILYCKKIIEYGHFKTNALYYLIRKINKQGVQGYGHLVYVLCEILLYCPVARKDQRITDNLCLRILQDEAYGIDKSGLDTHFNFEIQHLAAGTLCHINDSEILTVIARFITNQINDTFKNKQRYHAGSQVHKTLLASLQHILMMLLKAPGDLDWLLNWCLDILVKLPHQPSVRICFEWIVALYFYIQKFALNEETLQILKSKNVPLTSQFFIMYWLLKHKISNGTYSETEYNYVLGFFLSHTMGQLFNVRLHAQYLSVALHKMAGKKDKFDYTIEVIENTFNDSNIDKSYIKLKGDYFANIFDIIANLNPYFIYYLLPKYCELNNDENIDLNFVKSLPKIDIGLVGGSEEFRTEWKSCQRENEEFIEQNNDEGVHSNVFEDGESMGTIQKKYIPWKNMSDINVYDVEMKTETQGDLILVASLIDKLPNLGGMARTSEVFGVKKYVVGSLRNLQDKQFQGLSVSAERWINIEEVRPGHALKEYLMLKKTEGYSVVAAEQTSTSTKLQRFKFPKKTILLLGHEKEGVPCDLLPIMDHCVEIPQQGYVRSLNVHVTAAIFVWEYVRQNVLK